MKELPPLQEYPFPFICLQTLITLKTPKHFACNCDFEQNYQVYLPNCMIQLSMSKQTIILLHQIHYYVYIALYTQLSITQLIITWLWIHNI